MQSFQFVIFIFVISLFTSSSHLFLGLPSDLVNAGVHSYTFLPCCYLAYDVCVRTKLIFVLWYSLWCFCYQSVCLVHHLIWSAMCHRFLWWVRRFFLVPSFQIPLIWILCFLLVPTFHRHMLPLVSLTFGTSVAWISWSIVYFWIDLDLHKMLCFLSKFSPLFLPLLSYFRSQLTLGIWMIGLHPVINPKFSFSWDFLAVYLFRG